MISALALLLAARAVPATAQIKAAVEPEEAGDEAADIEAGNSLAAKAFRAAADRVAPSIVTIETFGGVSSGARRGRIQGISRPGAGPTTGLIVSRDGYVVTSTFNFVDQPPVITVVLPDGQRHVAKLLGRDESRRICMLKIDGVTDLPVPSYAKPAELRIGQWAVSVGVGYGDFEPAISAGMIGALNRIFGRAVQTDANISPANYGGPLLDIEGRVIGICVPLQPQSDEQAAGAQWYDSGIGFAVPFADLSEIMAAMKSGKTLRRAGLNLKLEPAKEGGVTIVEVPEKSAAAEAGLAKGDRIVAIDAAAIREAGDFQRTVSRYVAEQNVRLSLVRHGKPADVTVRLEAASAISPPAGERLKGSAR